MTEKNTLYEAFNDAMTNYFGYTFNDEKKDRNADSLKSFAPPVENDGSMITGYSYGGGFHAAYMDFGTEQVNETFLINKYREMSQHHECEIAIDDIVNEAIVIDEDTYPINIVLDHVEQPVKIKKIITEEFDNILKTMNLRGTAYDIFRRWYIDGRLFYHAIIDDKHPENGIQEFRYVDPRKIKKIREKVEEKDESSNTIIHKKYKEYYLYNETGFTQNQSTTGLKISVDSIIYIHSGITDFKTNAMLSHLHKAIKPLNQLRAEEDSSIIYKLARSPERRIFYIDVAGLPTAVAEKYVQNMIQRLKNKLTYDVNTGEIINERKYMTMLEDYFLPQREGKGTNVETLSSPGSLGELEEIEYFKRKLYKSLNVPVSRLETENQFNIGRASEITRDEVKFSKFIKRLRYRFQQLFDQALEKQLTLKGIIGSSITTEEWKYILQEIRYDFQEDNQFAEFKEAELLETRLNLLSSLDSYIGEYFSKEWVRKNILKFDEKEINDMDKEIKAEGSDLEMNDNENDSDEESNELENGDEDQGNEPNEKEPENEKELNKTKQLDNKQR